MVMDGLISSLFFLLIAFSIGRFVDRFPDDGDMGIVVAAGAPAFSWVVLLWLTKYARRYLS